MEIIIKIDSTTTLSKIVDLSNDLENIKSKYPETIKEISRDWRYERV